MALKFFKIICMARKFFRDPIYILTFCFEVVPALVLCAPIKRRASIIFGLNLKKKKKVYTNGYFLARRHDGLKLGSSLLLK